MQLAYKAATSASISSKTLLSLSSQLPIQQAVTVPKRTITTVNAGALQLRQPLQTPVPRTSVLSQMPQQFLASESLTHASKLSAAPSTRVFQRKLSVSSTSGSSDQAQFEQSQHSSSDSGSDSSSNSSRRLQSRAPVLVALIAAGGYVGSLAIAHAAAGDPAAAPAASAAPASPSLSPSLLPPPLSPGSNPSSPDPLTLGPGPLMPGLTPGGEEKKKKKKKKGLPNPGSFERAQREVKGPQNVQIFVGGKVSVMKRLYQLGSDAPPQMVKELEGKLRDKSLMVDKQVLLTTNMNWGPVQEGGSADFGVRTLLGRNQRHNMNFEVSSLGGSTGEYKYKASPQLYVLDHWQFSPDGRSLNVLKSEYKGGRWTVHGTMHNLGTMYSFDYNTAITPTISSGIMFAHQHNKASILTGQVKWKRVGKHVPGSKTRAAEADTVLLTADTNQTVNVGYARQITPALSVSTELTLATSIRESAVNWALQHQSHAGQLKAAISSQGEVHSHAVFPISPDPTNQVQLELSGVMNHINHESLVGVGFSFTA